MLKGTICFYSLCMTWYHGVYEVSILFEQHYGKAEAISPCAFLKCTWHCLSSIYFRATHLGALTSLDGQQLMMLTVGLGHEWPAATMHSAVAPLIT